MHGWQGCSQVEATEVEEGGGDLKHHSFYFTSKENPPKNHKKKVAQKHPGLFSCTDLPLDVLTFQRPEGSKVAAISSSKRGCSLFSAGPEVDEPWVLVLGPEQSCCGPLPSYPLPAELPSPPVLQECLASAGGRVIRSSGRGQ